MPFYGTTESSNERRSQKLAKIFDVFDSSLLREVSRQLELGAKLFISVGGEEHGAAHVKRENGSQGVAEYHLIISHSLQGTQKTYTVKTSLEAAKLLITEHCFFPPGHWER